jgi:Protein of unknown function (DUF3050)
LYLDPRTSFTLTPPPPTSFSQLEVAIRAELGAVVDHPIYGALRDGPSLRIFMRSHVFAVWDFMSLLKSLQRRLTGVEVPWLPPGDTAAARLVNEIVLGEESDEIAPGRYVSHYELYLAAMLEVGADARPVRDLVAALRRGAPIDDALDGLAIPCAARAFVRRTLAACAQRPVEIAATFLLGREQLVPAMFQAILAQLERDGIVCASFRLYLERHIEVDSGQHGPMAQRLLTHLCGGDEALWRAAITAAREALIARRELWDGVLAEIRASAA